MDTSVPAVALAHPLVTRPFVDTDLPSALRLWNTQTGWGTLTADDWRRWYRNTPYGDCLILVTVDGRGELAGQIVLVPSLLRFRGTDVKAFRVSSPILARSLREMSIASADHPLRKMFIMGLEHAALGGAAIAYATPWDKWIPVIRSAVKNGAIAARTTSALLPCLALPRENWTHTARSLSAGLIASPIVEFTSEHSALWEKSIETFSIACSAVRTPASLQFRNGEGANIEVREERTGKLVGYASIKRQSGLLTDLIAIDPSRLAPVVGAVAGLCASDAPEISSDAIQVMECTPLRGLRTVEGFAPVDFNFGFFAIALDPSLNAAEIDAAGWYINPGD